MLAKLFKALELQGEDPAADTNLATIMEVVKSKKSLSEKLSILETLVQGLEGRSGYEEAVALRDAAKCLVSDELLTKDALSFLNDGATYAGMTPHTDSLMKAMALNLRLANPGVRVEESMERLSKTMPDADGTVSLRLTPPKLALIVEALKALKIEGEQK